MSTLSGCVALVTGATRGIGKGVAVQLGEAGATVYITGRTLEPKTDGSTGGSLKETAAEIEKRGGRCISVQCNHKNDEEVAKLFEQISSEQNGRLDILVNNVYSAVSKIVDSFSKKLLFYEDDLDIWDEVNNLGLRNHYRCSVLAARLMVPRGTGLIIQMSSPGGLRFLFNVAYGAGKQALDRLAVDMGTELRSKGVAVISLWPGAVRTEEMLKGIESGDLDFAKLGLKSNKPEDVAQLGESTEYSGKAVVKLASDPDIMAKSARILLTSELGALYGFKDIDGREIQSIRSLSASLSHAGWPRLASLVPAGIKLPYSALTMAGSKF